METHSVDVLYQIFVMFAAAKLLDAAGRKAHVPAVISEIVAGILIGPSLLNLVQIQEWTLALAQLGAIVLLFSVGLSQKLSDLLAVGGTALRVAVLGVVAPFFLGWGLMVALGYNQTESVFLGAAMVATSVGISARVLDELGALRTVVATVILAAAVIDDILGIIVLALAGTLTLGVGYVEVVSIAALAVGFTLFVVLVGHRVAPLINRYVAGETAFALAMVLCLGLSLAAAKARIAAIIGAFLAGLFFSEEELSGGVKDKVHALHEFLVPFFFVAMGMQMNLSVLGRGSLLLLAALVTALAVVGKLIGCGLGAYSLGRAQALQVGVGMVPRGEVGLIVASIGLGLSAISEEVYAVVIIMVLVTTLAAPPALRMLLAKQETPPLGDP
ncbi:MAG: cation:proton antiporter [Candidatus Acidiferrales bacterium]